MNIRIRWIRGLFKPTGLSLTWASLRSLAAGGATARDAVLNGAAIEQENLLPGQMSEAYYIYCSLYVVSLGTHEICVQSSRQADMDQK